MNEPAAKNLVKTAFENPFSRDRFLTLTKNIFKSFDESKAFHARGYVKEKFKKTTPVIKTYERFGTFTDTDNNKIDILAVYLEKDDSLDRARTAQRNFVGDYLKQRDAKEAALVAFVPPIMGDWRLSLVKMDYHLGKSAAGKIKAITELTPARRFSFLVGANENTHTAQKQLLPILQDDEFRPRLTDLEIAFNVEVVTKDFFEKYKKLFLDTKEALDKIVAKDDKVKSDFQEKNIDTTDFAKKLLGQIVFLYFLQKKGWFGVKREQEWGSGPKAFLRELFEGKHGEYKNFFNDILEPLFYAILAVERPYDIADKFNCRIPFLNGGLFDPLNSYDWYNTDIFLSNELFSNEEKTKEGDTGDGILDVFDRYNFTVKEDEPLEREVAVDPEMLGKVFENLLEVKDRKSKGTYYTPREIVHYMCQESLINYLLTELDNKVKRDDIETLIRLGETAIENEALVMNKGFETKDHHFKLPQSIRQNANLIDEKLEKIRVCDPAVGSGAFLVGMMTEVIRVRNILTNYLTDNGRSIYDFKRHAIQNCLYGVDIDPGAVEIAKLRLWLSLIVDEQDIKQIKPLPNLDYKIVCGNSLLSVDKQNMFIDFNLNQIEKLKETLFNETNIRKKQEYIEQIDELVSQITSGHKDFDFEIYFSEIFHEKGGFDVVIANPPYLEARSPEFSNQMKNWVQRGTKNRWNSDAEYVTRGSDLLIYFFELGIYLLSEKGTLVFLTQNSWLNTDYGKKFQLFLLKNTNVKAVIDSDFKYFDSRLGPNINTVISIFFGKKVDPQNTTIFARYHENFEKINHSVLYAEIKEPCSRVETKRFNYNNPILKGLKWGTLLSSSNEVLQIISLLEKKGKHLGQLLNYKLSLGQGLNLQKSFVVDAEVLDTFPFLAKCLIPFMTTEDGAPFVLKKTNQFIVDGTRLDQTQTIKLENAGISVFHPSSTSKIKPLLIMPRGVSRHFCAMNSISAYSSSGVDIYDDRGNLPEEMRLNLWLFLNSSTAWLIREITGRKSLGGGLLKAEATDLRNMPIYFDFGKLQDIKKIYEKLEKRQALSTVDEIDTQEHQEIDEIVFDFLEVPKKQRVVIVESLKKHTLGRIMKSKT